MKNLAANPSVKLVNGQATTTSLKVAEYFGKQHFRVLRTIENLECSPEFNAANFGAVEYTDAKGEKRPMFTMTKNGFMFLAMGFTGSAAAQWKEKYIAAFDALEKSALEKTAAKKLPKPAAQAALPKGRYHYPRTLLNQAHFTSPKTGAATLDLSMLTCQKFISPLLSLLNQLRIDGHEVTAPLDEALAMRASLVRTEQAIDEITHLTIKARMRSAE